MFNRLFQPKAVFFTCIDSRMIPSRFTQTNVGDMFMGKLSTNKTLCWISMLLLLVRNAGNLVPHSQHFPDEQNTNEPAALELGCVVNDIRHIIVCGHSDCKAINLLYKLRDPKFASQVSTESNSLFNNNVILISGQQKTVAFKIVAVHARAI